VTELASPAFRLRLGGAFQNAWLASLTGRLAERHLSIDHIHARLSGDDIWIAELHLLALRGAPDPSSIHYVELAQHPEAAPTTPFEVDSFRLIESRDYGGTLMLTLEAKDSLGLLGSMLGSLARLGLLPVEMHIETRDGRAYDSLWLAARDRKGQKAPDAQLLEAARALLAGSTAKRG
jgi:hypothetical protein